VCENGPLFEQFDKIVDPVTIQLVSNCYICDRVRAGEESFLKSEIEKVAGLRGKKVDVKLQTTLEVIAEILVAERNEKQGRRYGHPILDVIRELNRYMDPNLQYTSGHEKKEIKETLRATLRNALAIQ
jgi:hypothetical protein